jgi:CubicO group peptidase (beta-lactamase class C family)
MQTTRMLAATVLTLAAISTTALGAAQNSTPAATAPATQTTAAPQPKGDTGAIALTAADLDAWLDGYLPYALKTGDIAGAVVAVVQDGQILTERGYGYSDVAKRTPVDPKLTLFRPGSVSKLFTWTAVMQLVEQGKIDLDADVNRYLDFKIPDRDGRPITMRRLRGAGQRSHFLGPRSAPVRSLAEAMGARARLCAGVDSGVFQLWRLPGGLHRAAAVGGILR